MKDAAADESDAKKAEAKVPLVKNSMPARLNHNRSGPFSPACHHHRVVHGLG